MPDQVNLLRLLGSGARVGGAPALGVAGHTAAAGVEHASFADLLAGARSGSFGSGREVTVDAGAGVTLTDAQRSKLADAADQAEAAGVRVAVVLLDDAAVIMDVATRRITGEADLSAGVLSGVDGVVNLRTGSESGVALGPPGAALPAGATLLEALKGVEPAKDN